MSGSNVPECAICHRPVDYYDDVIFESWCNKKMEMDSDKRFSLRQKGFDTSSIIGEKEITYKQYYELDYARVTRVKHGSNSRWKSFDVYLHEKFEEENKDRCGTIGTGFGEFPICPVCKAAISQYAQHVVEYY